MFHYKATTIVTFEDTFTCGLPHRSDTVLIAVAIAVFSIRREYFVLHRHHYQNDDFAERDETHKIQHHSHCSVQSGNIDIVLFEQ